MGALHKRIASIAWPKHIGIVDSLNGHAKYMSWLKDHCRDVPQVKTRFELYDYLERNYIKSAPIDYLEFGVYRGESFEKWLAVNNNAESRFFGFDSFEGLPEAWNPRFKKGAFDVDGAVPQIDDARGLFVKGWFQHSLPGFLGSFAPRGRLVLHNDSDLYSSTIYVLSQMDHLIAPGTLLIFDEFASPLHEFRAFNDYCSAFMRDARPIVMTNGHRWIGEQMAFEFL